MARNVQIKMSIQGDELFKLRGWVARWLVCDVPIKTPSARDLISGTAGTRAREYSQPDRASNAGYPKVPEDFTITEKDPSQFHVYLPWG